MQIIISWLPDSPYPNLVPPEFKQHSAHLTKTKQENVFFSILQTVSLLMFSKHVIPSFRFSNFTQLF